MIDKTPWLSVVVCTYQGELFLREALLSIEVQGADDIEIIAVDDGSTDRTCLILDEFAERLPLRRIDVGHSGNWIANTNRGIAECSGEYICFLHQDDLWDSERLKILRSLTVKYPDCGIFVHPSHYINGSGRRVGRWTLPFGGRDGIIESDLFLERLAVQNLSAIPAPFFRRELAERAGVMREDLWFLADWEYWGRLISMTDPCLCNDLLSSFRVHDFSQTSTRSQDGSDLRRQYHEVIDFIISRIKNADRRHISRIRNAAYMNCEVSIMLALMSHGRLSVSGVLRAALKLSPAAWIKFWRDSRLCQRVAARMRA